MSDDPTRSPLPGLLGLGLDSHTTMDLRGGRTQVSVSPELAVENASATCPSCSRTLSLDADGVPVYECHGCRMAWPVSFFDVPESDERGADARP